MRQFTCSQKESQEASIRIDSGHFEDGVLFCGSQDEDGRCYSDSFQDMPSTAVSTEGATDGSAAKPRKPTFEAIKRNLDRVSSSSK